MKISKYYKDLCQRVGAMAVAPSSRQISTLLLMTGVVLLATGISAEAHAYTTYAASYNDARIAEATDVILTFVQGSFGALVMIACGVGAILSSAFGQYRASLGLMVVAVGSFILRSLIATWFNDQELQSK